MDWVPINWSIIKNPANWVIIILMIVIASFAFHLLLPGFYNDQTSK